MQVLNGHFRRAAAKALLFTDIDKFREMCLRRNPAFPERWIQRCFNAKVKPWVWESEVMKKQHILEVEICEANRNRRKLEAQDVE